MVTRLGDLDAVFVCDGEPHAGVRWRALKAALPRAIRVDGLRHSWSTVRRMAALVETERFVVVQGDTLVDPAFAEHAVEDAWLRSAAVIAWPTRNAVNGLRHTSGALRCHARRTLAGAETAAGVPQIVAARTLGTWFPSGTPRAAFSAGFRNGVREGLLGGRAPGPPRLGERLPQASLKRLVVWATIGADAENGLWCIYGARLGCAMAQLDGFDPAPMLRADWIAQLWTARVGPSFAGTEVTCAHTGYRWDRGRLADAVAERGEVLRRQLDLDIADLDEAQSGWMRSLWARDFDAAAFDRLGNLLQDGSVLPADPVEAARAYAIGAGFGSSNAADNLARLHLKGAGVPKDVDAAVASLAQASDMGSPHAPYHLAQVYLRGDAGRHDPSKAASLLRLACARGFARAHAVLAELHRAGEGVPHDLETALVHGLRAGDAGADVVARLRGELDAATVERAEARARRDEV